jgi:hypothetical protein
VNVSRSRPSLSAALLWASVSSLLACTDPVSLLDIPDSSVDAAKTRVCPESRVSGARSLAVVPPGWGEPRALVAREGIVHVVFAGGLLARLTSDGVLSEVATLAESPVALAVDATFVYAVVRGGSEVVRVDAGGKVLSASSQGATAVTVDPFGRAYWALPDSIVAWNFASAGGPTKVSSMDRPLFLTHDGNGLFVVGKGYLYRVSASGATSALLARCGNGAPAVSPDSVHCADGATIVSLDLVSGVGKDWVTEQPGANDVVVARGRIVWRTSSPGTRGAVMARAKDGNGPARVLAGADANTRLLATDGCSAYFFSEGEIFSYAL